MQHTFFAAASYPAASPHRALRRSSYTSRGSQSDQPDARLCRPAASQVLRSTPSMNTVDADCAKPLLD